MYRKRFRRRYTGRKRRRNFRYGRDRRSGMYGRFNKRAKSVLEKKFLDFTIGTEVTPIEFSVAGTILQGTTDTGTFLNIAQGTKENERIGRKVIVTNVNWNICIRIKGRPLGTVVQQEAGWDVCRIMLYIDKQCNGATASVANLIDLATTNAFRNIENTNRFIILHDKRYSLRSKWETSWNGTINEEGQQEVNKRFSINWKGALPIEFNSTAGAILEIRSYNICAMIISQNATAQDLTTQIVSKVRIRFYG